MRVLVSVIGVRQVRARTCFSPHLDMFPAIARQAEGDLGRRRPAQNLVEAAVRRRGVPHHGPAGLGRGEGLGLFVHRMFGPPPPLLVDIGAVRRVHQADDGVVDMAVEIHRLDQLGLAAHHAGEDGRFVVRLHRIAGVRRHPDEDDPLAFAHRIGPHADAVRLERLRLDQRRNGGADPVGPEAPAVIGAFHRLALAGLLDQTPRRQGRGPVGADVAHRIDLARAGAADQNRLAHDLVAFQASGCDVPAQGDEIPGVGDESLAERLRARLGRGGFGHDGGLGRRDGSGGHPRCLTAQASQP